MRRELAEARKQPPHGAAMPPAAAGTCYPLAVQLICKTTIGSETGCDKLSNGRQQSKCAGICCLLGRQRTLLAR